MRYVFLSILAVLIPKFSFADEQWATDPNAQGVSSSGDRHLDQVLPGEEITTANGKKMKVWSTRGPVPVSRAPEPFEDREKSTLDGSRVIVDESIAAERNRPRPRNGN